ncbi:MAG: hypothetical protein ABIQ93_02315 [Saprospiraceae bacterium]
MLRPGLPVWMYFPKGSSRIQPEKQAPTRQARIEGSIERLRKGLKNPAGR